jgi:hypothetical protein
MAGAVIGRPRNAWRRAAAIVLGLLVLGGSIGAVAVDAAPANGVTWKIDDTAKTITGTVRITLTPNCSLQHMQSSAIAGSASRCKVTQAMADEMKANIEKIWNGHKYYCYDIVIKVEITIDNNPSDPDPTDRTRVQVDQSPVAIRSFVSVGPHGTNWNGNAPGDQLQAENLGMGSSAWAYPQGAYGPNLYAHEAGHILGLDDTYEDYKGADGKTYSRPKAGAPVDIMNSTKTDTVDRVTSDRLAERAGAAKSKLKCNYKIDQHSMGGKITGKKCDPLGGQWVAEGTYTFGPADGSQEWIISVDDTTKKGHFTYTDHQVAEFIKGIVVTTDGQAFGDASFTIDDDLYVHFHLVEQWHIYTATAAGQKGHDQNAAPTSADLIWDPIGKCT